MFKTLHPYIALFILTSAQLSLAVEIPFLSGDKNTPKYTNITFWDPYIQDYRGIRAIFYTVLNERENKMVDKRLHDTFANLLGFMCQKVITLDSIDNQTQKQMVENVLVNLVDQWKLNGKIVPDSLFQPLPFIDADVIIFMERTTYDQIWQKEDKKLLIGLNVAAFELDLGEPLYANRFITEVPWSGEDTSYTNAEREAIMKVINAIGKTFNQAAQIINRAHELETHERQKAEFAAAEQRKRELLEQNKEFATLIRQANSLISNATPDMPIVKTLRDEINTLQELTRMPVRELTDEQVQQRNELAYSIQTHGDQLYQILNPPQQPAAMNQQPASPTPTPEPRAQYPSGFTPIEASELEPDTAQNLSPIPSLSTGSGNIFDRGWLIPNNSNSSSNSFGSGQSSTGTQPLNSSSIEGQTISEEQIPSATQAIPSATSAEN